VRPGRLSGVIKRFLLRSRNAADIVRKMTGIERSARNYATFFLARPRAFPSLLHPDLWQDRPSRCVAQRPPPSPFLH
jgi:hypothetical protein